MQTLLPQGLQIGTAQDRNPVQELFGIGVPPARGQQEPRQYLVKTAPDLARRVAADERIRLHHARDHRVRGDDRAVADAGTGKDH